MSDDRSKEYIDKSNIHPNEDWERDYWKDKWGISDKKLTEALEKTGTTDVKEIENYLINNR